MMDKEKAQQEIQRLVAEAYASLDKAEALCDEYALSFSFAMGYLGGGEYVGTGARRLGWDGETEEIMEKGRWVSSSENC